MNGDERRYISVSVCMAGRAYVRIEAGRAHVDIEAGRALADFKAGRANVDIKVGWAKVIQAGRATMDVVSE